MSGGEDSVRNNSHFQHLAPWLRLVMTLRMLSPRMGRDTKVLDVGCGDGTLMRNLSGECVGIDVSVSALESAKANSGAEVLLASASALPFRSETFDVVVCTEVLEHLDDMEGAVEQMVSVTKLNGTVHFTIPLVSWYRLVLFRVLGRRPYYLCEVEHKREFSAIPVERFTSLAALLSLMSRFGLDVVDIRGAYFLPDKVEGPLDAIADGSSSMRRLFGCIDSILHRIPKMKFFGRYLGLNCQKARRPQTTSS